LAENLRGKLVAGDIRSPLRGRDHEADQDGVIDCQDLSAHELDLRIEELLGSGRLDRSPTSDCVLFCSLLERYGVAVYPTATNDNTRGPAKWFGQSYESLPSTYSDPDMKTAGCRAILRRLIEIKNRAEK